MISQRVRDIGLMKAAGCPNSLIVGYFKTELLIVTFSGCFLGVVLGVLADFASTSVFNSLGFQFSQEPINLWLVLLVFVVFFILASLVGAKPIYDTAKVEPAKAISPTFYYGLGKEPGFRVISKSGFTMKIAWRNLFRYKSATIRIALCLTIVFVLVTVAVAGGIIADQTTKNWVERAIGKDVVLIAHREMGAQYRLLLSEFYEQKEIPQFNYTDEKYLVPEELLNQLMSIPDVRIDPRLVTEAHIREIPGYTIDPVTGDPVPVGSNREGVSMVVGVDPEKVVNDWFLDGEFLKSSQEWKAVIGDTIAQRMFSKPLDEGLLFNGNFDIVGICIDPIANGNVTYLPLKILQQVTNISRPNIIMVKISPSANHAEALSRIRASVSAVNSEFEVFELNEILDKSISFLGYLWSTVMLLPLFSLVTAALCLVGYVMLAINEQRQEFGVLRAVGAKPNTVVKIISGQSLMVLLLSYAAGIAVGIILTLLILVPQPLVTGYTIVEIAGWLLTAFVMIFVFSLYPAIKFARKPILEITAPS
jgi:ABC-type lipoprotein release transport system permease subunit